MVKRLRRNMDIMDTMDDNTCSLAVHTVHIVHIVHSSLREQQLSIGDRLHSRPEMACAWRCETRSAGYLEGSFPLLDFFVMMTD